MSETAEHRRRIVHWLVAALLFLGGLLLIALRSDALSPQRPPEQRPLLFLVFAGAVSWLGFVMAYRLAAGGVTRGILALIITVALVGRAVFLPTELVQSDDAYRYLLDGHSLLAGINPYGYTPAEIAADPPRQLLRHQRSAGLEVIRAVNNPDVPTIYPPLAQCAFALGAALTPWDIFGQRVVFLCCDLATMVALLYLLQRLALPLSHIVLYAWNPLIIKEISNTAHVDSLVGLCLVTLAGLLIIGRGRLADSGPFAYFAWAFFSGLCCGAAILAKLYPLLLVPLCLAWFMRARKPLITVPVFVVATAMYVGPAYLMFLDVSWSQITAGLQTYSAHWVNNAGLFALTGFISDSPRTICWALTLGVVGIATIWLLWSVRSPLDWVAAVQVSLLAWFVLLPACFPWYVIGLLAVSVLRPRSWAVMLTGVLGLYYAVQFAGYLPQPQPAQALIQAAEHGVIVMWFAFGLVRFVAKLHQRV